MKVKVKIDINAKKIMEARGLGASKKVQKYLASEVKRLSEPYTPMQSRNLINNSVIAPDGSSIVYTQPYAHYQYYGKVMAGRPPKKYTGDDLTYSGGDNRGARWTERMFADKKAEIESNIGKFIGG